MYKQLIIIITGSIGGLAAYYFDLPIPWLLGSLIAILLLSKKIEFATPNKTLARNLRILLGVSIGGLASESLDDSSKDILSLIIVSVLIFVFIVTAIGALYFKKNLSFNKYDSLIASLPGGLTFILSISDGIGASFPKIAMMHTVRMVILVAVFSGFAFFISDNIDQNYNSLEAFNFFKLTEDYSNFDSIKLIVLVFLAYVLTRLIRFSGGDLILPLILSLFAYKLGHVSIPMPEIINILAMVVFGAILGQKISSKWSKSYISQAKASGIFTIFCLISAFATSHLISHYTGIDYFLIFLALAPGSIPEISLIAIALGYNVGIVAVAHIFRYLFIMLIGVAGTYWLDSSEKAQSKSVIR